ncbi:COX15/CtaA family protein [Pseudomonadota bacterium]
MKSTINQRPIAIWLFVCCLAIFAMVLLGGVTRLTGSGLSMVKWEPITGVLPPLNQTEWNEVFQLYQQSPEYIKKNSHFNLEEFKSIFWFEYSHRILGRLIGVIFLIPMLFFIATRRVGRTLTPKLVAMFILGGLQGLLGWYMVKSGLVSNPHVSQYRLTAHFGLAVLVYGYIFWVALGLFFKSESSSAYSDSRQVLGYSRLISILVFITLLSGGFVAGLKAGFAYNTFPLMNGQVIPDGILRLDPLWRNFFENIATVQFDHRVLATLLFFMIPIFWWRSLQFELSSRVRLGMHLMFGALLLQITLGISTLLLHVPIPLASAHQGGALLLFTASLFVLQQLTASKAS